MSSHVMTPKRRAALKKAQLISARKRRKAGSFYTQHRTAIRRTGMVLGGAAVVGGVALGISGHKSRAVHGTKIKAGVTGGSVGPYGRPPNYGFGPRGYPSHVSLGTGGTSWNLDRPHGAGYRHRPVRQKSTRVGRANPHEDIVAAYRLRRPVIGAVHTTKSATPHVHTGPVKYRTIIQGRHAGDVHVTKGYNR